MKKNMKKITVMLITIISVCMLIACGNVVENLEETVEVNTQEVVTEEVVTEDATDTLDYEKLVDLESKNNILVDVYNEVASLAVANGWEADSLTVEELNAADSIILINNSVITDQTNITNADVDELISTAEEITAVLDTNTRAKVSEVYTVSE